jgi:hypothetical protein
VLNAAHLALRLAVDWLEGHVEGARISTCGDATQATRAVFLGSIRKDDWGAELSVASTLAAGVLVGGNWGAVAGQGLWITRCCE